MKTTRRGFLRKGSAAVAGAGLAGAGAHKAGLEAPVGGAQAIVPLGIAGGAAAAGLGYMAYEYVSENYDLAVGDDGDYSGYTGKNALYDDIELAAQEMRQADEQVMTSISNNIKNSENIALAKGKAAIIREMNAGNSESAAKNAMEEAIDSYYSTIQHNLLLHYEQQISQQKHFVNEVHAHSTAKKDDIFEAYDFTNVMWGPISNIDGIYTGTFDVTLLDGRTKTFDGVNFPAGGHGMHGMKWYPSEGDTTTTIAQPHFRILKQDSTGTIELRVDHIVNRYKDVIAARDNVFSNLNGFVSDVYAEYEPDDIPTEKLIDPITAATELQQNYDHWSIQAAHAAMMGIPSNAETSLRIEVRPSDGSDPFELDGDLYTNHVPTDSNGNEVGFKADGETEYKPSTWAEPAYIAYKAYETDSDGTVINTKRDFEQIENPFVILEATDSGGNDVDNFSPEESTSQSADVSKLEKEIEALRKKNLELQKQAQERVSGGASSGSNPGVGSSIRNWAKNRPAEAAATGGGILATLYALSGAGGA